MEGLIVVIVLALVVAPLVGLGLGIHAQRRLTAVERRLRELEQAVARAAAPPAPPEPARPAPITPAPTPPRWAAPQPAVPRPPAPDRPPVRDRAPAREAPAGGWSQLEGRLGGTWLNRVGALVLTLGVAFFLKYAFDNSWIQPAGRVALGVIAGVVLLVVGERLTRAAYRGPALGVVAAGLATLYLSTYAAYGFYQLVAQPVAFGLMVLVTATGLALALHHDARALAVLANLGGFLTPVVLSANRDAAAALFTYLAVLDAGMLVSAYFRRWPELGVLSFVGTQALYAAWFAQWYQPIPAQRGVALVGASLFFVLFSLAAPLDAASRARAPRLEHLWRGPALLALAAPTAYFLAARAVLWPTDRGWLGLLCLVLAAYYLGLGRLVASAPVLGPPLLLLHGAVALAFLTLTFPVQFDEHAVAIAWSVEGLAIVWGGLRVGAPSLRLGGLAVLALGAGRWLTLLEEHGPHRGVFAVDHPAFPVTLALAAATALAALAYRRPAASVAGTERYARPILALAAVLSPALFVSVELARHTALGLTAGQQASLMTLAWLAAGVITLGLATTDPTRVLLGAGTLVVGGVGIMAAATDLERWRSAATTPVLNLRFAVGLLITAAYAGYARSVGAWPWTPQTRPAVRAAAVAAAALFLLWHLSVEVMLMPLEGAAPGELSMARHMGLSILWTLYAFAVMGIGLQRRLAPLRFGAIGLFALTVAKVFLIDLARLDAGYRILSFVVLGGLLILASFLYTRYRERIAGGES
jgi:uncharacterized membrane protein